MQKNSGGGEDLIRGGDIFYLGGCTPPCTPPEKPPMHYSHTKMFICFFSLSLFLYSIF